MRGPCKARRRALQRFHNQFCWRLPPQTRLAMPCSPWLVCRTGSRAYLGGWLTDTYSWRWAFYIKHPCRTFAIFRFPFVWIPPYNQRRASGKFDGNWLGLLAVWLGPCKSFSIRVRKRLVLGDLDRWAAAILLRARVISHSESFATKQPLWSICAFPASELRHRCLLIGLFGAGIYALVTLLPLFYQELNGLPRWLRAGGEPRGIGAIVAMPIIGYLTAKIDNAG